jgi:glycosyltransferase involved in cell wall biosynthesis
LLSSNRNDAKTYCWPDNEVAATLAKRLMHIVLFHFYSKKPNPVYQEIALALRRRGHTVWIGQPDERGDLEWRNGEQIVARQPGPYSVPAWLRRVKPLAALLAQFNYARFVLRVRRFLTQAAPDVVQVNLSRLAWLLPLLSGALPRYVYDIRQINEEVSATLMGRVREALAAGAMSANARFFYAHTCFCHVGAAQRILGKQWAQRGSVVPVGIDQAFLAAPQAACAGAARSTGLRFVYVGTLSRLRSLEKLMRAIQRVAAVSDQFQVDFIGPDTSNGYYQRCIEELGIAGVAALLPPVHYTQIPGLLQRYDVGLAYVPDRPTWHYQPTIKVLEYRALGLPILSTNVASHREVVEHEVNGLLVADTEEALADGIERFVCDRSFLQQVCQAASVMRRGVTWDEVASQYEAEVYHKVALPAVGASMKVRRAKG